MACQGLQSPYLPIQFRSDFKLATLVCVLIHTGFPKYLTPHLRSQSVANLLNVPKFPPSIYMSTEQFGFSLASVWPLMHTLFGIHFLKTSVYHPLLPH